jgi:LacI family transcriptional regulator
MGTPRRIGLALEVHLLYKHHTEIFAGVQRYADERGWLTVFDDWIEETLATSPRGRPAFDGVIARVGSGQLGLVDATAAAGVPLVNVLASSPAFDRLPGVFHDYEQVGRLRAEHLMSRGLRHFACWSIAERPAYQRQSMAFAETVAAAGYSVTRLDLPEDWGDTIRLYRKNQDKIRRWMDTWMLPIGLATPADTYARLIAQLVHGRGWRVPEDVAIVGGTNEELLCESPRPTLTSIEMGFERVGYEAARLLESLMDEAASARRRRKHAPRGRKPGSHSAEPIHVVLPPVGVVVRESTDFFASGDDVVTKAQAFIAGRCHMPIDVSDVAANVCVSVRTLQNRFAEILKRTVAQEIRRVRIEKAKRELTNSDRSIHEIALRAGFKSNARLCDVFQREVGVSPSVYRTQRLVPRQGP